jgi:uncharacterized protein YdaU (DUF1376 family)
MSFPRMSWHIGDYKKDTGHLRAAGHGAYFLLTMHYWATGGLPDDDFQLSAIACMTEKEWKRHRPILQRFFHDGWKHKRIDWELGQAHAKYTAKATAGRRGGEAKANNKQNPSCATANPKQPITDNPTEERKKEDTANAVSSYFFEYGVIKLTEEDFRKWEKSYKYLELAAELTQLAEWAGKQPKWFFAVPGALAKRNREIKEDREKSKTNGEAKLVRERGDAW